MKTLFLLLLNGVVLFSIGFFVERPVAETTGQPGAFVVNSAESSGSRGASDARAAQLAGDAFDSAAAQPAVANRGPGLPLFKFSGAEPGWYTVNDDVMGGISRSQVVVDTDQQRLSFSGDVSLENNGGFASTRSQWAGYDLNAFDGIALRVRGDGNDYRFRIRTEETGFGIAYTALFSTEADTWKEIYIPFSEMVPLYRGFVVNTAGPLDPGSVRSFGLMVSDKQQGEFSLEVEWINAVAERKVEFSYAANTTAGEQVLEAVQAGVESGV